MADDLSAADIDDLVTRIEAIMGERPSKLTRPGGAGRPIYRAYFPDRPAPPKGHPSEQLTGHFIDQNRTGQNQTGQNRTVIVSAREEGPGAATERAVLRALGPLCPHVPKVLAHDLGLTVTSDGGITRLTTQFYRVPKPARLPLMLRALDTLHALHVAAEGVVLPDLPHLHVDDDWIRRFVFGPERMAKLLGLDLPRYDPNPLIEMLRVKQPRFVKWDARAANAAVSARGTLMWFDFEHAGLRIGVEDFGWLLADEAHPIALEAGYDQIAARLDSFAPDAPEATRRVLEVFTCLQASYRLRVILNEVREKSWTARRHILNDDLVGADPYMAERLARNGAFLAALHPETSALEDLFLKTAESFRATYERRKTADDR